MARRLAGPARSCARTGDNATAGATARGARWWTHSLLRSRGSRRRHRRGELSGGQRFHGLLRSLPPLGKQQLRVDVAGRVCCQANSEVDIGLGAFGLAARADRADDFAFIDGSPRSDRDRSQMNERDRIPVLRADCQAAASVRNLAGERDDSSHRSAHLCARRRAYVDPAVLPSSVRVVAGDEGPEHRAVDRPAPARRARRESKRANQSRYDAVS